MSRGISLALATAAGGAGTIPGDLPIPTSRLQVIPDAGHTSTIEEPTAVNAAIADFLAGLGGE
ncbi:MAG TPA: alpha/beta hydrolase [Thermoanaerobaculia bacterium]|nr:alpha/beta hydrolase [Thermoanaerobaculia bacterium]